VAIGDHSCTARPTIMETDSVPMGRFSITTQPLHVGTVGKTVKHVTRGVRAMSEQEHGRDIRFLLVLIFTVVVLVTVLFAVKDTKIRDLQRRVGQLESALNSFRR
jgi:hypothetical protein